MTIEDYIVFRVNALLHAHDAKIVMRLEGGMSNYTYVVECQGKKYTYRVPGTIGAEQHYGICGDPLGREAG